MSDKKIITFKYPEVFTLNNALSDPILTESFPANYLPDYIYNAKSEDLFIGLSKYNYKDASPTKSIFIYLNQLGMVMSDPEFQYTQIPRNQTGFLAKISIPIGNGKTPEHMTLDYLVDISKIRYRIESVINPQGTQIIEEFILLFENITMSDYTGNTMQWDPMIQEFSLNRKMIFDLYF